eukprot:scaffold3053_cov214-Prasinococcus_capsulatus_cf.AAC.5
MYARGGLHGELVEELCAGNGGHCGRQTARRGLQWQVRVDPATVDRKRRHPHQSSGALKGAPEELECVRGHDGGAGARDGAGQVGDAVSAARQRGAALAQRHILKQRLGQRCVARAKRHLPPPTQRAAAPRQDMHPPIHWTSSAMGGGVCEETAAACGYNCVAIGWRLVAGWFGSARLKCEFLWDGPFVTPWWRERRDGWHLQLSLYLERGEGVTVALEDVGPVGKQRVGDATAGSVVQRGVQGRVALRVGRIHEGTRVEQHLRQVGRLAVQYRSVLVQPHRGHRRVVVTAATWQERSGPKHLRRHACAPCLCLNRCSAPQQRLRACATQPTEVSAASHDDQEFALFTHSRVAQDPGPSQREPGWRRRQRQPKLGQPRMRAGRSDDEQQRRPLCRRSSASASSLFLHNL